jgi:hypothetical protein
LIQFGFGFSRQNLTGGLKRASWAKIIDQEADTACGWRGEQALVVISFAAVLTAAV